MDIRLSPLIAWPDRNNVQKTMPYSFRRNYGLMLYRLLTASRSLLKNHQIFSLNHAHGHHISITIWQSI